MLNLTRFISISVLGTVLTACSLFKDSDPVGTQKASNIQGVNSTKLCADDAGVFSSCQDMQVENKTAASISSLPNTNLSFNRLGEYTEQMAAELENNLRGKVIEESIVVASFVYLDSSLQNTNTLGVQLAELFINDLQQIGLPVADHKLMGVLDVNTKGDFAFSRNMKQFHNDVNIGYVLTGTMLKNTQGMVINARLINFTTNRVVASSSKFLPNLVVNSLM